MQKVHSFKPAFGISNPHLQTIYSSLFRKFPEIEFEIETFKLSDGDFLQAYWHKTDTCQKHMPICVLFHGLAGSYNSPYIKGAMLALTKAGFDTVLMHFRGCSGVENSLARSYHSGDTQDAKEYLQNLKQRYPESQLYAVGYSLGANMLLKLLGEIQKNSLIKKAVAVSAPMLLDICAKRMNRGFSRYYQHRLLQELETSIDKKYETFDMQKLLGLKRENIKKLKTFWEFDDAYTAPIHGFKSAQEYYDKCSSRQFLKKIQTATLIIHAKDDPFMTQEVLPVKEEISEKVEMEISKNGGHVGFIGGTLFKPEFWLEKRIVEFFKPIDGLKK